MVENPKILFLSVNYKDWMHTTLYDEQQAIKKLLPNSVFYGAGYNLNTTNVNEIIEIEKPDILFCYITERYLLGEPQAATTIEKYNLNKDLAVFPKGLQEVKIPKVLWIGDFWHCSKDEWDYILLTIGFDTVFSSTCPPFASKDIYNHYFSKEVQDKVKFIPYPRAINPEIFKDYELNKNIDVSVLGAMELKYYPLRNKMRYTFLQQSDINFYTKQHPGYHFVTNDNLEFVKEYAKAINRSKLFATCTGIYNLPLLKPFEVLACKTALLCDKPHGADLIGLVDGETYIEVNENNFLNKAKWYLRNPDKLQEIANNGYKLFLERHTTDIRAKEFVNLIQALSE